MPFSNIDKPNKYFNTVTYTGTGSNLAVTGVGFKPDWVWCKSRSAAEDHTSWDAVRGSTKRLSPNTTTAEYVDATQGMQSFNTDGFTCGVSSQYNASGQTQVSWCWLGANTTVSNTSGTITSTVSANTTSGFSVGTYTGNSSSSQTVGHGLGVAPSMIIVKCRDNSANEWVVYHKTLGTNKTILLNSSGAEISVSNYWGSSNPTSSVFGVYDGGGGANNKASQSHVFYAFAEVKGFSKAFSYTGNGSSDGTFVYCGFKPAWILIKCSSSAGANWQLVDNRRSDAGGFNVVDKVISPNASDAEYDLGSSDWFLDIVSNGFKLRNGYGASNTSGATYIGFAIAESPFVSSKSIPTTAR